MTTRASQKDSNDDFKTVGKTSARLGKASFEENLQERRAIIHRSRMFKALSEELDPFLKDITKIRCLAIGSFHEEFAALYQLALLLELLDLINPGGASFKVSIYDPVFTDADRKFIGNMGSDWTIDEKCPWDPENSSNVLFFLPHAPLDLTQNILISEKPKFFLANHIAKHVDRYTRAQLALKYPVLAKLNHVLASSDPHPDSGFKPFVSRKARRKQKHQPQESEIDYDKIETYFQEVQVITDFSGGRSLMDQPWINSFSDLALQLIV
ncbi:LADA_0H13036g1_1 [Lachancea dasiensis]|uniref:LADA_0H13036g1_1 n=1 Tax=Lachancea dasiensis TaxID=1072105 RepID=A0A1G4K3Z8_9SACH|nr:LADA_0H13036g1_1 [Lachancea dasiensis]